MNFLPFSSASQVISLFVLGRQSWQEHKNTINTILTCIIWVKRLTEEVVYIEHLVPNSFRWKNVPWIYIAAAFAVVHCKLGQQTPKSSNNKIMRVSVCLVYTLIPVIMPGLYVLCQALGGLAYQAFYQRILSASSYTQAQMTCFASAAFCLVLGIPSILVGAVAASTGTHA